MERALLAAMSVAALTSCSSSMPPGTQPLNLPGGKVVVFGIPGVTWEDITRARPPTLTRLASGGLTGNVSIRIANNMGEGYATLGAASRTLTGGAGGWAFNLDEVVENGPASSLYQRRSGETPSGSVVVVPIKQIEQRTATGGFAPQPGLIGESLRLRGGSSAVVGNADHSLGELPDVLPPLSTPAFGPASDPGIHREAALAAMDASGRVARGDVGRSLLVPDPHAPFGVATSLAAQKEAFLRVWPESDLVVVETGDTYRADAYGAHLEEEDEATALRTLGLQLADLQIRSLLEKVDMESTLVVIVAPTTPGGPAVRGQLRPVIMAGAGIEPGLATSRSTRRTGLVTAPDLAATIARQLELSDNRFGGGRLVELAPAGAGGTLVDMNARAVMHDELRAPISGVTMALQLVIYMIVIWKMSRGSLPLWGRALLASSIAFPLATFVSHTPLWRWGILAAALGVMVSSLVLGVLATFLERSRLFLGMSCLLAAIWAFYMVDLLFGAPAQLDSILGYTSVAGGRFFGLGNLGFALLAGSAVLLGGTLVEMLGRRGLLIAFAVLGLTVVAIGHPALGNDVGGIITMVPAVTVFAFRAVRGSRVPRRYLPAIGLGVVVLVAAFGAIDLARPAINRTHLGDFLSSLLQDPASSALVVQRKAGLAIGAINYWAAMAAGAVAVLIFLHRRAGMNWGAMVAGRPGLRAALDSACVAALVGSLVNDSGVAVGGMILAIAAPWALLVTAELKAASAGRG
ncbi:MAG: hypothetical protein WD627_10800 [Actinomycetota bacterium]